MTEEKMMDVIGKNSRKMVVFLGLGSNLGDRVTNLDSIIAALPPEVTVNKVSSIYQTKPWGFLDQPDFLNQVVEAETNLSPEELLDHVKDIEIKIGRKPNFRFGPRLVDIDILFYEESIIDKNRLIIPHKHLKERAFVLIPLAEIAPDFKYPGSEETMLDLIEKIDCSGVSHYQDDNG